MKRTFTVEEALDKAHEKYEREAKKLRENYEERRERIIKHCAALDALAKVLPEGMGEEPVCGADTYSLIIGVTEDDVMKRDLKDYVGNLTECGTFLASGTEDDICVMLHTDDHPLATFLYRRPLRPEDPCKVVLETKTERKLVCPTKGG